MTDWDKEKRDLEARDRATTAVEGSYPEMADDPVMPRWLQEYDSLQFLARGIMVRKRGQRGHANITEQGVLGVLRRMTQDKAWRLLHWAEDSDLRSRLLVRGVKLDEIERLLGKTGIPREELIEELMDIANYAYICALLINGQWGED